MQPSLVWPWRIVGTLLAIALALLTFVGLFFPGSTSALGIVGFALVWGVGFTTFCYRTGPRYRRALASLGLGGFPAFLVSVVWISTAEEVVCASFGCTLAIADLALDLLFVVTLWTVWLCVWWFFIARRYKFTYDEALLLCACTGVLFEIVSKPGTLANPILATLAAGPVIVVYAGICAWPVGLIEFTGTREGKSKYVVGFLVPYLAVLPVALVLFGVLSLLGWSPA